MNKKLLALAVVGAFAAPAAMADSSNVTIGGMIGAEMSYFDADQSSAANALGGESRGNVNSSNGTEIYFRGTEDLGNGLSGVWNVAFDVFTDGSTTTASTGSLGGTRNTFVGVESKSWGRVIIGKHDTPYKTSTGKLDLFSNTSADYNSLMGTKGFTTSGTSIGLSTKSNNSGGNTTASFDTRATDMVMYSSPSFSGFQINAQYSFTADTANLVQDGGDSGDAYSLSGVYENGPIFLAAAYEMQNLATGPGVAGSSKDKAWKIGGGYNFGAFRLVGMYESIDDARTGAVVNTLTTTGTNPESGVSIKHDAWYLGASYTMGNIVLKAAYADIGDMDGISSSGANQWTIGADYNLSKRTKLYALYTSLNNDDNAGYSIGQGGLQVSTNGAVTGVNGGGGGAEPSLFGVGVHHSF